MTSDSIDTTDPTDPSDPSDQRSTMLDHVTACGLFLVTAAVVIRQSSRLTVLWDLSYVLENATRIALGDVPYRDFPFPYAPLTFVMQAALIRLFGRSIVHHLAWAALAGGAATALTYSIIRHVVRSRATALTLTLPLTILGIYCIFPHPFYDPDGCLLLLGLIYALIRVERPRSMVLLGMASVLPLFVKQNIGLAFVSALVILIAVSADRRRLAPLLVGLIAGVAVATAGVALLFGLGNYIRWTIRFAAERRLPPLAQQLSIFTDDDTLWWWLAVALAGAFAALPRTGAASEGLLTERRRRIAQRIGAAMFAIPLLWSVVRFFITDDPLEPEVNLLRLWPLALACAGTLALVRWRRAEGAMQWMPLLVAAAIAGTFLSQSAWGSTYGIWPLLILLFAFLLRDMKYAPAIAALLAGTILLAGWPYVRDNQRLTYAKWSEGPMHRSSLAPLRGLSMRGEWLPDFEELVAWSDAHIPRQDAIFSFPGEDLFYFTTGRRPRVPALLFDRTVNPFDARQLSAIADARHVRWLIVKKRLQINGAPMENLDETLALLRPRFAIVARLHDYDVYERTGTSGPTVANRERTPAAIH
jgi:hypothetical protein